MRNVQGAAASGDWVGPYFCYVLDFPCLTRHGVAATKCLRAFALNGVGICSVVIGGGFG